MSTSLAALIAVNAWGDIVGTPEAALPDPLIPGARGAEPGDAGRSFGLGAPGPAGPSG